MKCDYCGREHDNNKGKTCDGCGAKSYAPTGSYCTFIGYSTRYKPEEKK